MKSTFTFTLSVSILLLLSTPLRAQSNIDPDEMIGFACYYSGSPTKPVVKVTRKVKRNNYKAIVKMLRVENNAEKYMAVISLEKLHELGKIKLNSNQRKLIQEIKNYDDPVSFCAGCTSFIRLPLKDMFGPKMGLVADNWLNANFQTEK